MDLDSCLWQDLQLLISCTVCLEMASVSYGYAITTYVGQNLRCKRISQDPNGVRSGVYMALITSIVISGVMVITGRNILSLFVSGEAGQVKQDIGYCIQVSVYNCNISVGFYIFCMSIVQPFRDWAIH